MLLLAQRPPKTLVHQNVITTTSPSKFFVSSFLVYSFRVTLFFHLILPAKGTHQFSVSTKFLNSESISLHSLKKFNVGEVQENKM